MTQDESAYSKALAEHGELFSKFLDEPTPENRQHLVDWTFRYQTAWVHRAFQRLEEIRKARST
jgi:hypothetical protein